MTAKDLRGKVTRRDWPALGFQRPYTDYVCRACLAIVPDLQAGCQYCQAKQKQRSARLHAFLTAQAGEVT